MSSSQPLRSPFGRVFSRPEIDQVMNCALGLLHPIDIPTLKSAISSSLIPHHPRFTSLLIPTSPKHYHWTKTTLNIDEHVIPVPLQNPSESAANAYLAELALSPPMSREKPLWEVHVLEGVNCVVLRVHHALGDGISLMSLLRACFGSTVEEVGAGEIKRRGSRWRRGGVWGMWKSFCYTASYEAGVMCRILGCRDGKTVVSGGKGVELWAREVVTASFDVHHMNKVKMGIPNATMNDVLLGVISSGLSKYLDVHSPKAMVKGINVSSLVVANLRKHSGLQDMWKLMNSGSGSCWGNKFGLFVVPINCRHSHEPLKHVSKMKSIMDRKKQSFEAHLLHSSLGFAVSLFGPKVGGWFYKRVLDSTTLLISNIVGPHQEISIAGNPVTFIKLSISSLSQAMTLHLMSYNGRAELQISVAKDIIPDAEFLAKCFEDALVEMESVVEVQPMPDVVVI